MNSFGISNTHHVVLYDNSEKFGLFSAPRVWWLFNVFGHTSVSILDGGLPKWKRDGYATVSGDYLDAEKFEGMRFGNYVRYSISNYFLNDEI